MEHERAMSRHAFWWFSTVAVVLVGLVLGTCLSGLAEAVSPAYRVCSAVKGEELSPSKTSPLSLVEVPVASGTLPRELPLVGAFSVDLTPDCISAVLYEDLSSRAPPTLL